MLLHFTEIVELSLKFGQHLSVRCLDRCSDTKQECTTVTTDGVDVTNCVTTNVCPSVLSSSTFCVNHRLADESVPLGADYSFFPRSNLFYKYSHRDCPDAAADSSDAHNNCGSNYDLTRFKVCPSWLNWEPWSNCFKDQSHISYSF